MRETHGSSKQSKSKVGILILIIFIVIVAVSNFVILHSLETDHHESNDKLQNKIQSKFRSGDIDRRSHNASTNNSNAGDSIAGKGEEKSKVETKDEKIEAVKARKDKPIKDDGQHHEVAGLSCEDHGGPSNEVAEEMVFWSDIESDSDYKSPFYDEEKYITFEPDHGGWNNIRMAMETILVLAHAMGRTLVLPPRKGMYLLGKGDKDQNSFSFNDFFHLDAVAMEHEGLNIITMEEFLKRKGVTGQLKSVTSGEVMKPPNGQTNYDGKDASDLYEYLEKVGKFPESWEPSGCIAAIPSSKDPNDVTQLQTMFDEIMQSGKIPDPAKGDYDGQPTPVDAPAKDRLREILAKRKEICIYDTELQNEDLIHFKIDRSTKARMLTHFYAFVFFQDWKQDLWSKRFVRDHVRYIDEIVCAAARIVHAVREKAKSLSPDNVKGEYNSFHVRRGDFQYKKVKVGVNKLYEQSKDELEEGSFLYIATDERKKEFFDPLREHYQLGFLDDYMHLIEGLNPNYYGMLDQLVAYKGKIFFGTFFSTLTGYVNRMRGYYSVKHQEEGFEKGILNSYYFVPEEKKLQMREYKAVKLPLYMREFPVSWRDIDKGIGEL